MKKIISKHLRSKRNLTGRSLIPNRLFKVVIDVISVGILTIQKGSSVLPEDINADIATNLVTLVAYATGNKNHTRRNQDHPKHTN